MKFRRNTLFFVMSLLAGFFLSACGGGGGDGSAPLPPTVTTSSLFTPEIDNAIINGSVNPNGLATTAWFEYGTDSSLSTFTKTADQTLASGVSSVSVNATLLGLTPGTQYYFRVAASSTAGASKGTIVNFTTTSPPPTTTTTQAGPITIASATLNGSVNPNGLATTAWFEHGTDPSLTTFTKTADQAIGSGNAPVSVTQPISGLLNATTYYFRVAATSTGGSPKGAIIPFITDANPKPVANAGTDQSQFMGNSVTLNGSGSSDGGNGGTITYLWTQVGGTAVALTGATTAAPTFTAPTVAYPSEALAFQLTVTSSRGPTAADNVTVTDKWGFIDDFSTNTPVQYTILRFPPLTSLGTFTWDATGQRAKVLTTLDNSSLSFSHNVPASNKGILSLDFNPTAKGGTHGGIRVRLLQDPNNFYEIANFDYGLDPPPLGKELAEMTRVAGLSIVDKIPLTTSYTQGNTYHIKITFSTTQIIMEAFSQTVTLPITGSFTVNIIEVETGNQDAYYDNIKLEAGP